MPYADLSIAAQQVIDLPYLLNKIKDDGFSTFAIDYTFSDEGMFKENATQEVMQKIDKPSLAGLDIYSRATLQISQNASLHPLGQQKVPCDIVAVKPLNERIFHSICTEYDSYDLITFEIGSKLPFMLKRSPVHSAISRGKYFEICYDAMFDEDKRVCAMTNIANIIKATAGKHLIISSHIAEGSQHRTPFDVAALMISLGLDKNKALKCMKEWPLELIRSAQHRQFFKGTIREIPVATGKKLSKRIKKHREDLMKMKSLASDKRMAEE